jgi:hypothetical protein
MSIWLTIYLVMTAFILGGISLFWFLIFILTGKHPGAKIMLEGAGVGLVWPLLIPLVAIMGLVDDFRSCRKK